MNSILIIYICLFLVLILINIYQVKTSTAGSDHYFHFAFIKSIKNNKYRFFTKINSFINESDYGYPQFYHWLLSFLSDKFLQEKFKYFGLSINIISFTAFNFFLYSIYPFFLVSVNFNLFVLISGLFYILTPFEYFSWNAKNVGLSARGFGLLFGQLFLYSNILFLLTNNFFFLGSAYLLSFIILISSQFSYQFVLFFSIISSVVFSNIYLLLIPFSSILLLIVIMPTWAKHFLSKLYGHKKMYFRLLSFKFGLKQRFSIWRDFVYDFYTAIKDKGVLRGIEYIYRNPIIEILIGFPVFVLGVIFVIYFNDRPYNTNYILLFKIISIPFIIFLLTSFRKTRFLGEPQRYVEFLFPVFSVLPFILGFNNFLIVLLLLVSIGIIFIELIVVKKIARKKGKGLTTPEKMLLLLDKFQDIRNKPMENRIISNNFEMLKYFSSKEDKILNVNITEPYTAGLHFNEVFPESYGIYSNKSLLHFTRFYNLNWFILDTNLMTENEFLELFKNINVKKETEIYDYLIFRMDK